MIIRANGAYDFEKSYQYMKRQDDCLYEVLDGKIRKAEIIEGHEVLFELSYISDGVKVNPLVNTGATEQAILQYVEEWLDLSYHLEDFYQVAADDARLASYLEQLYGFRMVGYVDISNAFLWAILGQQINMGFAYILKRRIIEYFDHHIVFDGIKYLMMPSAKEISSLSVETLHEMQISRRKAEYIISIMSYIEDGTLSKDNLLSHDSYDDVVKFLVSFRGIGPWSANTVLLRSLKYREAVPIGDAGLKNVFAKLDGIEKPSIQYVKEAMKKYGEHGMYATVYLWEINSLL